MRKRNSAVEKTEYISNENFNNHEQTESSEERRERLAKAKLDLKIARAEKNERIKRETEEERRSRLEMARRIKLEMRKERRAERAKREELKEADRKARIQRNKKARAKRRKEGGNGGWIAAVVSLSCAVLILGSMLALSLFTPLDDNITMSSNQERSFYELVGYVDNMDVNLSKFMVSNGEEQRQKLLGDIEVQSNLATGSLSSLALNDETKFYTAKFINQVGDFAKYLQNKLIDGETLTDEDMKTLGELYKINVELKNSLSTLASSLGEDFEFKSVYEGKSDNIVIDGFTKLEDNALDYPKMIYDGPFSDALKVGVAKGLVNESEITPFEAEKRLREYFSDYEFSSLSLENEAENSLIECYNFVGVASGNDFYAQISKKGGKLIMFTYYKDCTSTNYDEEYCIDRATEFLKKVGFPNMEAVWHTDDGHTLAVNFVSKVNGIICYNDMVKVNVCRERGIVYGIEANSYYLNHSPRDIPTALLTPLEAESYLSDKLSVQTARLVLAPKGDSSESLCYEYLALYNGETYYVYIDALSGKEINIYKVVDTVQGQLLL